MQTSQMEATPTICCVPALIYGYSSHLICWHLLDNCAHADCSTTSDPLHASAVVQGIESKPEPIMLQNLRIILSRILPINSPIIPKIISILRKSVYNKGTLNLPPKKNNKKDIVTIFSYYSEK